MLEDIQKDKFSIPVGLEEIKSRAYSAYTPSALAKTGKPLVIVETIPSEKHAGYISYSILNLNEKIVSKSPVLAQYVDFVLDYELEKVGITCAELKWKEPASNNTKIQEREYVYFLKADRFLKIGRSSGSPYSRIASLQTGCPFPLVPIAHISGGSSKELELHKRFNQYRVHGEWFLFSGELVEFINSIKGINQDD